MIPDPSVVEVTFESALKNVEVAEDIARRVSATVGFDEDDRQKIELAVHEAMINAIWHGNKNDATKQVWLQFRIHKDRLEIQVRDQGFGFDLSQVPDPLADENLLKITGRGIFLMRSFMDDIRVENTQGSGTNVILVKRFNSNIKASPGGGTEREHEGHNT